MYVEIVEASVIHTGELLYELGRRVLSDDEDDGERNWRSREPGMCQGEEDCGAWINVNVGIGAGSMPIPGSQYCDKHAKDWAVANGIDRSGQ
jgi:hypothetical protein